MTIADDRAAAVCLLYRSGKTIRDTATAAGVSKDAVARTLRRHGVEIREHGPRAAIHNWTAEQDAGLATLWKDGFTHDEIAERIGHSVGAVRNRAVVVLRLPARKRGRRVGAGTLRVKPEEIEAQILREDEADARAMSAGGRPPWVIAEFLGWPVERVRAVVRSAA